MSINRLPSSFERNTYVNQADERTVGNPISEQDQEKKTQPVMRQRQTGREDDEDEKDQEKNSSLLNQHSKPQLTSRVGANQASLQLESRDEEKFVYTKKQFNEAIEKDDVVTLVRMLRHGVNSRQDLLTHLDVSSITKNLISTNKSALLAELIRENKKFETQSREIFYSIYYRPSRFSDFVDDLASQVNFVKAMDNHRALPQDFKKCLLSNWLGLATQSGKPDLIKMVIQLESSLLSDEAHDGYYLALDHALRDKNDQHELIELILKNMFFNESQVKVGINSEVCSFAAGLAVAISRPDWAILLQNGKSKIEKSCETNELSFPRSLAYIISSEDKNNFMEDLVTFLISTNSPNKSKLRDVNREVLLLYGASYGNSRPIAFYRASNALINEGIRPDVAEVISEVYLKCWDALVLEGTQRSGDATDQDSSDSSYEDSDDYANRIPDQKRLQSLLANQLRFLTIEGDQADEVTLQQISALSQIGKDFTKNLLGDIPKLVDKCFTFINTELALNADQLKKFLIDDMFFPKSLARFLAESMSLMVANSAKKPGMVMSRPMSALEINEYVRNTIKENACREFKNNFSEIIKQQQLMTLFNKDSEGREDLWQSYFFAYLDVLKAALPASKTEH